MQKIFLHHIFTPTGIRGRIQMGGVPRMPYREIPIETKINAVMDHIRGIGPSEIERKHHVDRDSLRLWVRKAKAAIFAALTPNPGRPPVDHAERFSAASQQSQKSDAAEPAQAFPSSRTVLSGQCPLCGGSRLARNGCYTTGASGRLWSGCSVLPTFGQNRIMRGRGLNPRVRRSA